MHIGATTGRPVNESAGMRNPDASGMFPHAFRRFAPARRCPGTSVVPAA